MFVRGPISRKPSLDKGKKNPHYVLKHCEMNVTRVSSLRYLASSACGGRGGHRGLYCGYLSNPVGFDFLDLYPTQGLSPIPQPDPDSDLLTIKAQVHCERMCKSIKCLPTATHQCINQ